MKASRAPYVVLAAPLPVSATAQPAAGRRTPAAQ